MSLFSLKAYPQKLSKLLLKMVTFLIAFKCLRKYNDNRAV